MRCPESLSGRAVVKNIRKVGIERDEISSRDLSLTLLEV
jgi:hypothetical protein